MSRTVAFWVGDRPNTDEDIENTWHQMSSAAPAEPSQPIRDFLTEITTQFPDDGSLHDNSPWGDEPLINNASGDLVLIPLTVSRMGDSIPALQAAALRHGLIFYDPTSGCLIEG